MSVWRDRSRNNTGSKEEAQHWGGDAQEVSLLVSPSASPDLFLNERFHLTTHLIELSPSHLDPSMIKS